jgi:hypothetical protein
MPPLTNGSGSRRLKNTQIHNTACAVVRVRIILYVSLIWAPRSGVSRPYLHMKKQGLQQDFPVGVGWYIIRTGGPTSGSLRFSLVVFPVRISLDPPLIMLSS